MAAAGIGTALYALAISPLVQLLLPRFTEPEQRGSGLPAAAADPAVAAAY